MIIIYGRSPTAVDCTQGRSLVHSQLLQLHYPSPHTIPHPAIHFHLHWLSLHPVIALLLIRHVAHCYTTRLSCQHRHCCPIVTRCFRASGSNRLLKKKYINLYLLFKLFNSNVLHLFLEILAHNRFIILFSKL